MGLKAGGLCDPGVTIFPFVPSLRVSQLASDFLWLWVLDGENDAPSGPVGGSQSLSLGRAWESSCRYVCALGFRPYKLFNVKQPKAQLTVRATAALGGDPAALHRRGSFGRGLGRRPALRADHRGPSVISSSANIGAGLHN